MVKKYVKKSIPIEALQWTGMNRAEILSFCHAARLNYNEGDWHVGDPPIDVELTIKTLEGDMHARKGDYIIKGIRGEFYPCERTIFEETYEEYINE